MSWKTSLIIALVVGMLGSVVAAFAWEVNLQWDDPNNDPAMVAGYNLRYRRPALGEVSYVAPPIDVGDNLTFIVTNLQNSFEYCFVVSAYALDIPESSYSNELCINSSLNSKPVVSIEEPVTGSTVFGTQVVRVRVTDPNDLDGSHVVTVDINNLGNWMQAVYNVASQHYETIWNTATVGLLLPQLVELVAIAVDPGGLASDPALTTVTVTTPFIRTIFSPSSIPGMPASTDGNAVELGVRFTSDVAGLVTGVRFYKGLTNIGPHTGSLWTDNGQLLGTVIFANETSDGWQEALFANPIAIAPGVMYVVSYHTASGNYAFDANYFASAVNNSSLHAPASINGVYQYGSGGVFPSSTYNASNYWVDVVMEVTKHTLFSSVSVPGMPASTDGNAVELGVRFSSDVNASVIGIRFYKGTTNVGPHTGNLWTNNGQLLGTVLFVGETPNGWQEAFFITPIPITANTTYVVSYHTASGNYAFDANYFASAVNSAPLYAPAVLNGVYEYGVGGFPSSTYNASNYWVDVVTVDVANVVEEIPKLTLFSSTSVPGMPASTDGNANELGVRFTSDVNASVIGVRFYKGLTNIGPHTGSLWTDNGQLLGTVTFANETQDGWQEALFVNPIPITAGTVYVASYHTASGNYAFDANYFALPVDNSSLHAPASINGVYQYGSGGVFPSSTYNASNYWVDVVVSP